jgi:RNA polymerase sigma factor (sigma-70 family)
MEYTDQDILNAIKEGDDNKVMAHLYKKVLPNVVNMVSRNSGSSADAHDVFQDAIVLFYRQVVTDQFNDKYKIYGYLFTISKNLWINKTKKKSREVAMNDTHEIVIEENILDNIITQEKTSALNSLFAQLGDKCIELLTYSVYHKLSMKEIAVKMGLTGENTAKTNNYRCKQKLMKMVKQKRNAKELLR